MIKREITNHKLIRYFFVMIICFGVIFLFPAFVNKALADSLIYRGTDQNLGCGSAAGNVWDQGPAIERDWNINRDPANAKIDPPIWHVNMTGLDKTDTNLCAASGYSWTNWVLPNQLLGPGKHSAKVTTWECKEASNPKRECAQRNIPYCGTANGKSMYLSEFNFNSLLPEHSLCAPGNIDDGKITTEYYKTPEGLTTTTPLRKTYKCSNSIIDADVYSRNCSNFPSATNHLGNSCVYAARFDDQGTEAHQRALLQADWESRKPSCGINIKTDGVCNLNQVGTCLSGTPGPPQEQGGFTIWQCSGINGGLDNLAKATDTTSQPNCSVPSGGPPNSTCTVKPIYGTAALVVEATVGVFPGFNLVTKLTPPYNYQIDFNYGPTPAVKAFSSTDSLHKFPLFSYTKSGKYQVYYNIQDSMGKYAPCLDGKPSLKGDGWCPCGLNYEVEVRKQTSGSSSEVAP